MDILKHLKKLEDKLESIFEPGKQAPSGEVPHLEPGPATQPGPADVAPTILEPATTKMVRPGPTPADPTPADPTRHDPTRPDTNRPDPTRADPLRAEPSRAEQPRAEQPRAEPARHEPVRREPPRREPPRREPLELKRAILTRIEEEVRRIDGKPAFPFNRIDVTLWAPDARAEALLSAELIDDDRLKRELVRALEALRVTPDRRLELRVRLEADLDRHPQLLAKGFSVECSREQETDKLTRGGGKGDLPLARLVVEQGTPAQEGLEQGTLTLQKARVNLGRLAEVVDDLGRVVRRNELAFRDEPGINATVSRVHAHVAYERESGEFRLFDDNSAEGTTLFREGRRIDVPRGQRRGVLLLDGDEIYLGQARVRFVRP